MIRRENAGERGSALVMALLLVVTMGAMVASLTSGSRRLAEQGVRERAGLQALDAADGGIELARCRLASAADYRGERLRIGAARVAVVVAPVPGGAPGWQVRATAEVRPHGEGAPPHRLSVTVRLAPPAGGLPRILSWRRS